MRPFRSGPRGRPRSRPGARRWTPSRAALLWGARLGFGATGRGFMLRLNAHSETSATVETCPLVPAQVKQHADTHRPAEFTPWWEVVERADRPEFIDALLALHAPGAATRGQLNRRYHRSVIDLSLLEGAAGGDGQT